MTSTSPDALVSYAAMILADAEIEITSDKLLALTKAAGVSVEPVWAEVFAKATQGQDLKETLFAVGAAGPAAPAAGGAADASAGAAAEAAPAAVEESESSDEEMGMGLFD